MAKRKIIIIDEELCNGCGQCITACAEGALELVDGKARLVREQYCDGFGDCLGECPTGALRIEERESEAFDEAATREHVRRLGGEDAVRRMDEAAERHEPAPAPQAPTGGCPGARMRMGDPAAARPSASRDHSTPQAIPSELQQWPVQIHLVPPGAPFFRGRELAVLATCGPVASADVHWRHIRGRGVLVGCPKLDRTEGYVEKIAAILEDRSIPRVQVVRMEVPCCGGLSAIVAEAVRRSGRQDLQAEEVILGVNGDLQGSRPLEC